jgi:hypothetical protein
MRTPELPTSPHECWCPSTESQAQAPALLLQVIAVMQLGLKLIVW